MPAQPLFSLPALTLEPLRLWLTVSDDVIERDGVARQLMMRLLDDSIVDHPLAALIATVFPYLSNEEFGRDEARRHLLLLRSTRAMERQICKGTLQNSDQVKYAYMAAKYCYLLQ